VTKGGYRSESSADASNHYSRALENITYQSMVPSVKFRLKVGGRRLEGRSNLYGRNIIRTGGYSAFGISCKRDSDDCHPSER
jgi:hypothetical protein